MSPRVELVHLGPEALRALADGDRAAAERAAGMVLSDHVTGPGNRWLWDLRVRQVAEDPPGAAWVTAVVRDVDTGDVVGRAGFHGPPRRGRHGRGRYEIDPDRRRRGYARAALRVLLDRAAREPSVTVVRASVSPANEPSLALVRSEASSSSASRSARWTASRSSTSGPPGRDGGGAG